MLTARVIGGHCVISYIRFIMSDVYGKGKRKQLPGREKKYLRNYLLSQFWDISFCPKRRPVSLCHIFGCFIRLVICKWRFPFKHLLQMTTLWLRTRSILHQLIPDSNVNYLIEYHCKRENINLLIIFTVLEDLRSHISILFLVKRRKNK